MGKSSRVPGRGMPRFICSHLTAGYARTKERIVLHGTPNRHGAAEGGGDCWIWFKVKPGTYGRIMVNGKKVKAHRYSYEKKYGPIPSGLHACHTCDNPRCINPAHLFVSDNVGNMRDKALKRRAPAKLTDEQVLTIRRTQFGDGVTQRSVAKLYGVDPSHISRILSGANCTYAEERTGLSRSI